MPATLRARARNAKEAAWRVDKQAVTSFRFRLERVRAVRERTEKLAQEDLARSLTRLSSSQQQLRSAQASVERAHAAHRSSTAVEGAVAGAELLARQAFLERIEEQRQRQELELRLSEAEVAERNERLATAASEHEMLVRLRERRRGEHDREQARAESTVHDELAAVRFRRSMA
jgi:flagellar FliJ protein